MTDGDEYFEPTEPYEYIIELLQRLLLKLITCNELLQGDGEIEEHSEVDDYLVAVCEEIKVVNGSLEKAEEIGTWDQLVTTPIGKDLVHAMDKVERIISVKSTVYAEGGHEICEEALTLADVVVRLLGERE